MKVVRFAANGKWFGVDVDEYSINLIINPSVPEISALLAHVTTRDELLKVLDEACKELQDLKFKVEYGSSEKIWDSLNGEEDNF